MWALHGNTGVPRGGDMGSMFRPLKKDFHHAAPLHALFHSVGGLHATEYSHKTFTNPNFVNQIPEKRPNNVAQNYENASLIQPPCPGVATENAPQSSPATVNTRKRSRKNKKKKQKKKKKGGKVPEKHNTNRQNLHEIMDTDLICEGLMLLTPPSSSEDEEQDLPPCKKTYKLCDLIICPSSTSAPKKDKTEPPKVPRRMRCISVESEDSFIVFDSSGTDEDISEDEDYASDSSLESEDEDSTDFDSCSGWDTPTSLTPCKKVRFSEEISIQPMIKWSFAYKQARKGPWEVYARDRERFNKRIRDISAILDPVLDTKHRQHVYDQRFYENITENK